MTIRSGNTLYLSTSSTFLNRIRAGEEDAWSDFYSRYAVMIRKIGTQKGLSPTECDDLMVEVMVIFWKRMDQFIYDRTKGKFRNYLGQIADFCSLKLLRKKNDPLIASGDIQELAYPRGVDEKYLEEWREFLLEKALEELKETINTETWQVFYMSFFQNRSVAEISAVTRKSANNIYGINFRCTAKLKALTKRYRQMEEAELLLHSNKKQSEN